MKEEEYNKLMEKVLGLLRDNGLKAVTMDTVAHSLGMSKRTLYEIFPSKTDMVKAALKYMDKVHHEECVRVFSRCENVIEAVLVIAYLQGKRCRNISVRFFSDMDSLFPEIREYYQSMEDARHRETMKFFERGVSEGVFRPDVNYVVTSKMLKLQMESLKRAESIFPPEITLSEVFDSIVVGLLRGIATPQGMATVDNLVALLRDDPARLTAKFEE